MAEAEVVSENLHQDIRFPLRSLNNWSTQCLAWPPDLTWLRKARKQPLLPKGFSVLEGNLTHSNITSDRKRAVLASSQKSVHSLYFQHIHGNRRLHIFFFIFLIYIYWGHLVGQRATKICTAEAIIKVPLFCNSAELHKPTQWSVIWKWNINTRW
jgi:hypothetical protein